MRRMMIKYTKPMIVRHSKLRPTKVKVNGEVNCSSPRRDRTSDLEDKHKETN